MKKRLLSIALIVCLVAGIGMAVYADENIAASETETGTCDFPSSFDLRNVDGTCYVTDVRLQNPWGSCWAFGTTAAAEISILGELGLDANEANLNLSERYLAWFARNHIEDENSSQNGEGIWYFEDIGGEAMSGGRAYYPMIAYASGFGAVDESKEIDGQTPFIYDGDSDGVMGNLRDENGKRVVYENAEACEAAGDTLFCHADNDDWSIDESLRFEADYILEEGLSLPEISPFMDEDTEAAYIDIESINAVKEQLVTYKRGVTIGFYADASKPDQSSGAARYLNVDTWSHCTWEWDTGVNHNVVIVGYDDDYPASNFTITNPAVQDENGYTIYLDPDDGKAELKNNEYGYPIKDGKVITDVSSLTPKTEEGTHTPEGDGAWIVKNSWGASDNEFPDKNNWGIDGTGYFYISYYDRSISAPFAYDFVVGDEVDEYGFTSISQYDMMAADSYICDYEETPQGMANVFTADKDIVVTAVSCMTATLDSNVTWEIYILNEGAENPTDGTLKTTQQGEFEHMGFHMQKLDNPVKVKAGQSYSIVATITGFEEETDNYYIIMDYDYDKEGSEEIEDTSYTVGVINPGESYCFTTEEDGSIVWQEELDFLTRYEEETDGLTFDNFNIKSYYRDDIQFPTAVFIILMAMAAALCVVAACCVLKKK